MIPDKDRAAARRKDVLLTRYPYTPIRLEQESQQRFALIAKGVIQAVVSGGHARRLLPTPGLLVKVSCGSGHACATLAKRRGPHNSERRSYCRIAPVTRRRLRSKGRHWCGKPAAGSGADRARSALGRAAGYPPTRCSSRGSMVGENGDIVDQGPTLGGQPATQRLYHYSDGQQEQDQADRQ